MQFLLFAIFISSVASGISRYRTWYPTNSKVSKTFDYRSLGSEIWAIQYEVSFPSRIKSRKFITGIYIHLIILNQRKSFIIYGFTDSIIQMIVSFRSLYSRWYPISCAFQVVKTMIRVFVPKTGFWPNFKALDICLNEIWLCESCAIGNAFMPSQKCRWCGGKKISPVSI